MKTYKGAILDENGFIIFYVGIDAADWYTANDRMAEVYKAWVAHTRDQSLKWDIEEKGDE